MSKENVKKFFEEVSKNEDLQKQLKAATEKQKAEIAKALKAQAEAIAEVAKKAGFDFSADELFSETTFDDSRLNLNDLDAVAGGADSSNRTVRTNRWTPFPYCTTFV